jgi:light-harvesting protein B-800-850 alpha chain
MNNARMWLAVKPSIGIPLLIGSVAVQALIVHFAILTHTTWFPAFLQGGKMPQRVTARQSNSVRRRPRPPAPRSSWPA